MHTRHWTARITLALLIIAASPELAQAQSTPRPPQAPPSAALAVEDTEDTETEALAQRWSGERAHLVAPGRWELGLWSPSRVAINERMELSTTLGLLPLVPELGVKASWIERAPWMLSSTHRLRYLTPLLRTLSRRGAGGLLPPDQRPPLVALFENGLLATRTIAPGHWMTLGATFIAAPRAAGAITPLEFPFLYPRTAAMHGQGVFGAHVRFEGWLSGWLAYELAVRAFLMATDPGGWAIEQHGALAWRPSDRFSLELGYRVSHTDYPFGPATHLIPTVDVRVGLGSL